MKRLVSGLLLLAVAAPAWADDAPYYGPMKRWHGIGYKFGYQDRIEPDGTWRIDTAVHGHGDAIDMALYRAAERARDAGYRYIFLLGARGSKSPGINAATLYARPSHDAVAPVGCRSKKVTTCYTADVAEILRILGGDGGTMPGVPIVDHRDRFGRDVMYSGYGTGKIVPGVAATTSVTTATVAATPRTLSRPLPRPVLTPPAITQVAPSRAGTAVTTMPRTDARFAAALKALEPVDGGNAAQGWTVSD